MNEYDDIQEPNPNYMQRPRVVLELSDRDLLTELDFVDDDENPFVVWLATFFSWKEAIAACRAYRVGTHHGVFRNGTVFPFIDQTGRLCSAQVKLFDAQTGKTERYTAEEVESFGFGKVGQQKSQWLHICDNLGISETYRRQADKAPFPIGLHLVDLPEHGGKEIAIVEAAKTAIFMSIAAPEYVWVAIGALNWLTFARLEMLQKRRIVLFPDKGRAHTMWAERAKKLSWAGGNRFTIRCDDKIQVIKWLKDGDDLVDAYLVASENEDA